MIILSCCCGPVSAQSQPELSSVLKTLQEIKSLSEYGYSYKVSMNFPDGQADTISGETFTSPAKGIVYNSSEINTIFYNGQLYYNANHVRKQVTVYKMNRRFSQQMADSMQNGVFQLFQYKGWMDSVIIKYGQVKGAVLSRDIISFDISFPPAIILRKISIRYDMAKKLPVRIEVNAVTSEDDEGQTMSTIVCTNYTRNFDERKLSQRSYFEFSGADKVVLNKYKNYKLFTLK